MNYLGIFRYLPIFVNLVQSDFRRRYLGTYLGALWAFAAPLSTIAVLLFVFNVGFRSGQVSGVEFDVWLISGLIVWFYISDGIISGSNAITEYSFLVKKMQFMTELLPIVKVTSSLYVHLINSALLIALLLYKGHRPDIYWLQLPYYFISLYVFVLSVAMVASVIQVFIKDFQGVISILMQIGLWGTPVLWDAKMLPAKYQFLVTLNPVNYLVQGYREVFLFKGWFFEHPAKALYFWGVTAAMLLLGMLLFKKTKHEFADVL
ncbi:hypothetical protein BI347_10050 [Chromobacterium sphagni]|uniref:Transport permease protein n=1 Tax=Chromobacterium sphagni TaxID=1903179 RepID=A0A1S1X338_9NEIS|nr:ABC transporter permease [Chromobacterium sphagni]OHX13815.1 hypothetical protein BI347_10050 [Chromobacterium sphagni]